MTWSRLAPLAYVAWADGEMDRVQKERIHAFAAKRHELNAAGAALLQRWLAHAPTHEYLTEGLRDILFLANAQDDTGVDFNELPALLSYAEGIARSTGRTLDAPGAVSREEDRALEEVARELHIDHGKSWAQVIQSWNDLATPASSHRSGRGTTRNGHAQSVWSISACSFDA